MQENPNSFILISNLKSDVKMKAINICLTNLDLTKAPRKIDVYMGEWCAAKQITAEKIVPYIFQNYSEVETSSLYMDSLIEKTLKALSIFMNKSFNVSYSERFWKLYITPFLMHWLGRQYSYYLFLNQLKLKYDPKEYSFNFAFLDNEKEFVILSCEQYLTTLIESDEYIHIGFQNLINELFGKNFTISDTFKSTPITPERQPPHLNIRSKIKSLVSYGGYYYLGNIQGLSFFEKFFINIKNFKNVVKYLSKNIFVEKKWKKLSFCKQRLTTSDNLTSYGFKPANEFENFIGKICIQTLPLSFFDEIPTQPLYLRVKYWIGNSAMIDQYELAFIGRILENGGTWESVQHGGGYGQLYRNGMSNFEYKIPDAFITWGWRNPEPYHFKAIPLPSPMLSKLKKTSRKDNPKKILYVGTSGIRIPRRFTSDIETMPSGEYKNIQLSFLQTLEKSILKNLSFRDHPASIQDGHQLYEFLKNNNIKFELQRATKAAQEARVVIVDHCTTTFIQTFSMNIPTIIFWNEKMCKLSPEAEKYFIKLKDMGIWHQNEQDASAFINKNINMIENWWYSHNVQEAVKQFLKVYGLTSENYLNDWTKFLRTLNH